MSIKNLKSLKELKKLKPRSEFEEQAAIFEWAAIHEGQCPELKLLNGSLNGVRINMGQAVKMKAAGMKKGYPDIFWPYPQAKYCGLFIELKRVRLGKITKEQDWWLKTLSALGYACFVCKGAESAIKVIVNYGGIKC